MLRSKSSKTRSRFSEVSPVPIEMYTTSILGEKLECIIMYNFHSEVPDPELLAVPRQKYLNLPEFRKILKKVVLKSKYGIRSIRYFGPSTAGNSSPGTSEGTLYMIIKCWLHCTR